MFIGPLEANPTIPTIEAFVVGGDRYALYIDGPTVVDSAQLDVRIIAINDTLPTPFPVDRALDYDPDDFFDPETQQFTSDPTDLTTFGGGRYGRQIVVLGHKKLYFGEIIILLQFDFLKKKSENSNVNIRTH